MNRIVRSLLVAIALLTVAGAARAQDDAAAYPMQVIDRPFTLFKGMTQAQADLGIDLSSGSAFQPLTPGITVGYGITRDFTIAGNFTLCLNGNGGCASAANSGSITGTYSIGKLGPIATALTAGLAFPAFSPDVELTIPVGALFRYTPVPEAFSIVFAPQFGIALTDRNTANFDTFSAPFTFQFQATKNLELQATLAFTLAIDPPDPISATDTLTIPVGVGATYAITNLLDVGGSFTFLNLLGKGFTQGADYRGLDLFVAYRM